MLLPTCRQTTLLVDALDAGRAPLLTGFRARFHLRYCWKCSRFAAQYRTTVRALRGLATPSSDSGLDAFRAWRARG